MAAENLAGKSPPWKAIFLLFKRFCRIFVVLLQTAGPFWKKKNSQSPAALGVSLVDDTGLEPVTPCTSSELGVF